MSRTNQNVQDIILTTHSRGPVSTTETASVSRAAQVIQVLPNTLITCLFIKQELLLFNQAGILITLIKLYLDDRSQGLFSCPIVISHLFFTPSIAYFASMFKDIHLLNNRGNCIHDKGCVLHHFKRTINYKFYDIGRLVIKQC